MGNVFIEVVLLLVNICVVFVKLLLGLVLPIKRTDVSRKVILITGSAHGIGKEMALRFHAQGAHLALIDINEKLNLELVGELQQKKSGKVEGYRCDLTDEQEIATVVKKILDDFGQVDILINNAGYVRCAPLGDLTNIDIRRTFNVNVFSHFWMVKQILPSMIERKSGQIVAISSIAGLTGTANLVDYCSSKFAVNGFMDALGCELRTQGHDYIDLTTICPLAISTGMFKKPKTRFGSIFPILTPEYTAEKIVDAVLEKQIMITIPKSAYFFYLSGKMMPYEAFKLIQNFFVYGVDQH